MNTRFDESSNTIDLIGFMSMGFNSHVCLELAARAKTKSRSIRDVLGGPPFGALGLQLRKVVPLDFVVRGDGVRPFVRLLEHLLRTDQHLDLDHKQPQIIDSLLSAVEPPMVRAHPWNGHADIPSQKYFRINSRRTLVFESGRGCNTIVRFAIPATGIVTTISYRVESHLTSPPQRPHVRVRILPFVR
jgi:radical SAM superfamily enzyme YgiQ (UPF0313 family)